MVTIAPPQVVNGAARAPLPYGLFSILGFRGGEERWENGVIFESLSCDPAGGIGEPDCEPNAPAVAEVFDVAITGAPTAGTFQITDGTLTSAAIAFNADAAAVAAALAAFGVTATGGPLPGAPVRVTFTEAGAQPALSVTGSTLDVGEATVAVVTPGSDAVINTIGLPKDLDGGALADGEASPFTVYGHHTCSPVGGNFARAQDLANQHLQVREEGRVEQALWTGDLGNVPNLSGANGYAAPVNLGTLALWRAVSLLEQEIAKRYGSLGVIHMSRENASRLMKEGDLVRQGGRLFTAMGTPIAAGTGYASDRIVGTPALFGYRGDVFTSSNRPGDLLDRATNDLYAIAERTYLVGFDECAVLEVTVAPDPEPTP